MTEAVTLHVVPSTWVERFTHMQEPYSRVVGVDIADGQTIWVSPSQTGDRASEYKQADTQERAIPLDIIHAQRLVAFFDRFMSYGSRTNEHYNCHRFAVWMTGTEQPTQDPTGFEQAQKIMEAGRTLEGPLRLGEHGIFGGKKDSTFTPDHSVIGLGEDRDDCLQVISTNGHLAVTTYHSIERFYNDAAEGWRGLSNYGMYVLRAAEGPPLEPETAK